MNLRPALPADAAAMVRIKDQLPMQRTDGTTTRGGFLLGTDEAGYHRFIEHCHCLVSEDDEGNMKGFGILVPDAVLKASELWQKRHAAQWLADPVLYDDMPLAYFEQLAFLPGCRRSVVELAFRLVLDAFRGGAEAIFAGTVREPIVNLAAVPFIQAAGGQKLAEIDEQYPVVGHIRSDIWCMERRALYERLAGDPQRHPSLHALLRQLAAQ